MFFVEFRNGTVLTEKELQKWDNVARDVPIVRIGVFVPVYNGDNTVVFPLSPIPAHCEKYCCTKLGRAIVGKDNGKKIGYALMGRKEELVYRVEITNRGLNPMKIVPAGVLNIREEVWRDGC
jgi:hypothetical protein